MEEIYIVSRIKYTQLCYAERIVIENRLRNGESYNTIAKAIGRSESTISREVTGHCYCVNLLATAFNPSSLQSTNHPIIGTQLIRRRYYMGRIIWI